MNYPLVTAVAVALLLSSCSAPHKEGGLGATAPERVAPDASAHAGPPPDSVEYFNTIVGNTVRFDFDEYDLRPDAQAVLRGQAAWLHQNPSRSVIVEGHSDERGTRDYNLGLSERRANSVRQYLVSLSVAANRIKTIPYGKERPLCVASEETCWAKNRRTVTAVE